MATLPNMNLVLPTLGGDVGTWDDKLDAIFRLLDPHDHTSGKGVAVPTAGLNIDADLAFGGNAATGLGSIAFNAVAALASGSKRLFVSSSDNELYWRTNGGSNVKITSGNGLNISLVGGIVGDYASVGAAVAYDDANDRYTFKQQSGSWARLHAGGLRLAEFNTTESVYVQLLAPSVLAASYDVTLASALPGGTQIVTISSAGALAYDGVLGNNQNITLSGTGKVKHGDYISNVFLNAFIVQGTATVAAMASNQLGINITNGTSYIPLMFEMCKNRRLKSVAFVYDHTGGGTINYEIVSAPSLVLGFTVPDFQSMVTPVTTSTTVGSNNKTMTLSGNDGQPGGSSVATGPALYFLKVICPAANDVDITGVQITWDTP